MNANYSAGDLFAMATKTVFDMNLKFPKPSDDQYRAWKDPEPFLL